MFTPRPKSRWCAIVGNRSFREALEILLCLAEVVELNKVAFTDGTLFVYADTDEQRVLFTGELDAMRVSYHLTKLPS